MVGLGLCAILFVWVIDGPSKDIALKTDLENRTDELDEYETVKLDKLKRKYPAQAISRHFKENNEIIESK